MNKFEKLGLVLFLVLMWSDLALRIGIVALASSPGFGMSVWLSPLEFIIFVIGTLLFVFGDVFQKSSK